MGLGCSTLYVCFSTAATLFNGCMYCIGDQYYRYTRKLGVDAEYPKPMSLWRGLPIEFTVDATVPAANSATYFFVGQQYYRFNDVAFNVRKLT